MKAGYYMQDDYGNVTLVNVSGIYDEQPLFIDKLKKGGAGVIDAVSMTGTNGYCDDMAKENFCEMMNEEALALGATNSHFVNPHGLTDDNHYTTVYDMYLIMNEAIKFEVFREIIHMDSYTTVYHDKNGAEKEITVNSTNYYFIGKADPPSGITILGGKTGTTDAAGHCLVLLSRDTQNKPYISVIMRSDARENLYISMSELLAQIGN